VLNLTFVASKDDDVKRFCNNCVPYELPGINLVVVATTSFPGVGNEKREAVEVDVEVDAKSLLLLLLQDASKYDINENWVNTTPPNSIYKYVNTFGIFIIMAIIVLLIIMIDGTIREDEQPAPFFSLLFICCYFCRFRFACFLLSLQLMSACRFNYCCFQGKGIDGCWIRSINNINININNEEEAHVSVIPQEPISSGLACQRSTI
jgi:hypothetical protein